MNLDLLVAQVQALKACCEAMLAVLSESWPPDTPAASADPAACDHPEQMRVNSTTLQGPPSFFCRKCRQDIIGPS